MSLAITWELERTIMGANMGLERGEANVPTWFAQQLQVIYAKYIGDVRVTLHGDTLTVERPDGIPRVLVVGPERRWELAASATGTSTAPHAVNMPGPIAAILSDP